MPQIRCIAANGELVGVIPTEQALRLAANSDLDLVEVSPNANPPVCRIMDFGKYKYEEVRKSKALRRHQLAAQVKEIKFHVNVDDHDYHTKMVHIQDFLKKRCRVKTSVVFRGRENEHREMGYNLLKRLIKDCEEYGLPDSSPRLFGKTLVMMLHPQHAVKPSKDEPKKSSGS